MAYARQRSAVAEVKFAKHSGWQRCFALPHITAIHPHNGNQARSRAHKCQVPGLKPASMHESECGKRRAETLLPLKKSLCSPDGRYQHCHNVCYNLFIPRNVPGHKAELSLQRE